MEEAGAVGAIEAQRFHLYLQPKGDSRLRHGVQEFVVKAFLLQVTHIQAPLLLRKMRLSGLLARHAALSCSVT